MNGGMTMNGDKNPAEPVDRLTGIMFGVAWVLLIALLAIHWQGLWYFGITASENTVDPYLSTAIVTIAMDLGFLVILVGAIVPDAPVAGASRPVGFGEGDENGSDPALSLMTYMNTASSSISRSITRTFMLMADIAILLMIYFELVSILDTAKGPVAPSSGFYILLAFLIISLIIVMPVAWLLIKRRVVDKAKAHDGHQ